MWSADVAIAMGKADVATATAAAVTPTALGAQNESGLPPSPCAGRIEALKTATNAALAANGRCKLVFSLGGRELGKSDDNDPCCGLCFEVTIEGVHVGEVMLGSKVEPEVLLGARLWVTPTNWYAPGPKLDACYVVRTEEPAKLDSDGKYSGQDTKRWTLMYNTKSWANNFMTLRGRWDALREATRSVSK